MVIAAVWKGDETASVQLQVAIEHNCTCSQYPDGHRTGRCDAHQALLDQRFLNGILWARWMRLRLLAEEFVSLSHPKQAVDKP